MSWSVTGVDLMLVRCLTLIEFVEKGILLFVINLAVYRDTVGRVWGGDTVQLVIHIVGSGRSVGLGTSLLFLSGLNGLFS